jgi:hypothetical protein
MAEFAFDLEWADGGGWHGAWSVSNPGGGSLRLLARDRSVQPDGWTPSLEKRTCFTLRYHCYGHLDFIVQGRRPAANWFAA